MAAALALTSCQSPVSYRWIPSGFGGREIGAEGSSAYPGAKVGELEALYETVQPGRSLLISKAEWLTDDSKPAYTLEWLLKKAVGEKNAEEFFQDWLKDARQKDLALKKRLAENQELWTAPFITLAVVNRLDNSTWNGRVWSGGEVRFVLSYINPKEKTAPFHPSIILEFALRPMDWKAFKAANAEWLDLSKLDGEAYKQRLRVLIEKNLNHSYGLRLRTNAEAAGTWRLSEWNLAADSFVSGPLEDQVDGRFVTAAAGSFEHAKYLSFWWDLEAGKTTGSRGPQGALFPGRLLSRGNFEYGRIFPGTQPQGKFSPEVINAVALRQCSGCHSNVSGTRFQHIRVQLLPEKRTVLSGFLTGCPEKDVTPECLALAKGEDIPPAARRPLLKILNHEAGMVISNGGNPPRYFNDLARRAGFMALVSQAPQEFSADWEKLISSFATDFAH